MRFLFAVPLLVLLVVTNVPFGPAGVADASLTTPTFDRYAAPAGIANYNEAGEPSIGVNWNTGAVMYQSYTSTYKVTFNTATPPAATWVNRQAPNSIINVDPIAFTDSTVGRTFAGGLDGSCSVMSYTDNDGTSWTPMGNVCAGAAFDHPTIGSGPWVLTALPHVYNRAVYYCAQLSVAQCAVSQDGGLTFGPGVNVPCGFTNPGLHGSVHVGPDGWAYLPFSTCGSVNGVAVSGNNGLSWASRPIPGANTPAAGFDPDVATTPNGTAWVAYPTSGYGVGVARTYNHGAAWTNFGDVAAAAGIRSSTFHEMVAGDNGRAAVAYLGSTTDGNPHATNFAGVWHVYVTYTFDNGATWTTVKTSDNIAQRGWICAGGTGCGNGRNLLDFIDATVDSTGRVVVGYADGCVSTCETGTGSSTASWATIARQSTGRTLFAAFD